MQGVSVCDLVVYYPCSLEAIGLTSPSGDVYTADVTGHIQCLSIKSHFLMVTLQHLQKVELLLLYYYYYYFYL